MVDDLALSATASRNSPRGDVYIKSTIMALLVYLLSGVYDELSTFLAGGLIER